MFNERNQGSEISWSSEPVQILGLSGAPTAGDSFNVLDSEQEARSIANQESSCSEGKTIAHARFLHWMRLRRKELGNFKELNVIIKGTWTDLSRHWPIR